MQMICAAPPYEEEARQLASRLSLSFISSLPENETPCLFLDEDGLALTGEGMTVRGDFTRLLPRLRPDRLRGELLVRAAGKPASDGRPGVDMTAGLGEDSFLLAAAGHRMLLFERDAVICALLSDALRRAAEVPELADAAGRITLTCDDSTAAVASLSETPAFVYLDPMFPARQKSGLVKKKFQLLHLLEAPCADESALFTAALAAQPDKIIVKRPRKAASLAGRRPGYSFSGKTIRYDCYRL